MKGSTHIYYNFNQQGNCRSPIVVYIAVDSVVVVFITVDVFVVIVAFGIVIKGGPKKMPHKDCFYLSTLNYI